MFLAMTSLRGCLLRSNNHMQGPESHPRLRSHLNNYLHPLLKPVINHNLMLARAPSKAILLPSLTTIPTHKINSTARPTILATPYPNLSLSTLLCSRQVPQDLNPHRRPRPSSLAACSLSRRMVRVCTISSIRRAHTMRSVPISTIRNIRMVRV